MLEKWTFSCHLHVFRGWLKLPGRRLAAGLAIGIPLVVWVGVGGRVLLHRYGYEVNLSWSMPIGLYRVTHDPLRYGQLVVVCLPDEVAVRAQARGYIGRGECRNGSKPVLKEIVAMAGDTVTVGPEGVSINGMLMPNSTVLERDSAGRVTQHVPWGSYTLTANVVWVMATHEPNSFDSRYLGFPE
jgi:conjugative transfer signal peptidase TraF